MQPTPHKADPSFSTVDALRMGQGMMRARTSPGDHLVRWLGGRAGLT